MTRTPVDVVGDVDDHNNHVDSILALADLDLPTLTTIY
jgi:hypothetical protein